MFWSEDERDVDEVEDVDVVIFFFVAFLLFFTFAFDFGLNVDLFCAAAAFSFAFFFDLVSMIIISTNLGRGRVSLFPNFLFLVNINLIQQLNLPGILRDGVLTVLLWLYWGAGGVG